MEKCWAKFIVTFFFILHSFYAFGQNSDSLSNQFSVHFELRPRFEYRFNNVQSASDPTSPFLLATQRNRISFQYSRKHIWLIKSELQEIHEWESSNRASQVGSINFYQFYFEYFTKRLKFRIGRQGVLLDNGRIFSDAPWAQQSRAHEGIRITEYSTHHAQDLFFLFTRDYGELFESTYSPVASHRYKYLLIHHLKHNFKHGFALNTINYVEFFENAAPPREKNVRATMGGRVEFQRNRVYSTVNGYFQFGKNLQGRRINAYYLQPEIRFQASKSTIRLGAEIISGSRFQLPANQSGSFDIRYGVAWKFMGNMNLFTQFPNDLDDKGLINPYGFFIVPIAKNIDVRSDVHLFFAQRPFQRSNGSSTGKFLGFEHDVSFKFKINKSIELNYGFSYYLSSQSMKNLPKILETDKIAIWSYLMFSYSIHTIKASH